jgi:hypothetical protein
LHAALVAFFYNSSLPSTTPCVILRSKLNNNSPEDETQMSVKTAPEEEVVNEGSKNDFLSLEEKVYRTIELLKNAREAKAAAERDAARVREQLELREEELELAKAELITIKREREEVKGRVEKMLSQIDNIVAEQAAD